MTYGGAIKAAKYITIILNLILILWLIVSWVDIIADNSCLNPVHYPWNAFVLMGKW